jgi:hypothetical protein
MASRGDKVVLFGGHLGGPTWSAPLGDTWEWDGSTWSKVTGGGPPARAYAAMAQIGARTVLFGGQDGSGQLLSDTWEWDGTAWTDKSGPGPTPRYWAAMISFQGKAILEGGSPGQGMPAYDDTWQWDGTAWTQLQANGPAEFQHAIAPFGCTIVLSGFSAYVPFGSTFYNETQIWNGTAWSASVLGPTRRQYPVMGTTPTGVLLFGGFNNESSTGGALAESWLWDGAKWALLPGSGPPGRFLTAMASY